MLGGQIDGLGWPGSQSGRGKEVAVFVGWRPGKGIDASLVGFSGPHGFAYFVVDGENGVLVTVGTIKDIYDGTHSFTYLFFLKPMAGKF